MSNGAVNQFWVPWQEKRPTQFGFFAGIIVGIAKMVYAIGAPIVSRFSGMIMIGAVVTVCLAVWAHSIVFHYVDDVVLSAGTRITGVEFEYMSPVTWGVPPSVVESRLQAADGMATGVLKFLLWPLQFRIVRDVIGMGGLIGLFNLIPVFTIWLERKVAGRIQSRLGPMRVGGWHGWSQSPADGIKLLLKEDLIPDDADDKLFRVAPYFAIIPVLLSFIAFPLGATYMFRELDVALLFILGVLGIEVFAVILSGWASNNKWSIYGAMREACQMVSYEIPMGMALLIPVLCVGSISLKNIGEAQAGGWFTWIAFRNPFTFLAFVAYFIASLASSKRAPFDLPEAESELVAGFHTEYSGFRWSLFFFAEYAGMFVVSGLAVIMFLGGWNSPLPSAWGASWGDAWYMDGVRGLLFSGPIWFVSKCVFFLFVQIWLRWTLPRVRIDQVLYACVQVLLPLTMVLLLGNAAWVLASMSDSGAWATFALVCNVVVGLVGMGFALMFPAIAAYGFYHRRSLVGNLVVDALPGS